MWRICNYQNPKRMQVHLNEKYDSAAPTAVISNALAMESDISGVDRRVADNYGFARWWLRWESYTACVINRSRCVLHINHRACLQLDHCFRTERESPDSITFNSDDDSVACWGSQETSVLMQRLSYLTETVLCNKITWNRIVLSFKNIPRKPLGGQP